MRLLIDMNLSPRWAEFLTANGHEAAHWSRLGPASAPDRDLMDFARASGHVILTNDLDFGAILAATRGRTPSVIQIRSDDLSPEAIGPAVVRALAQAGEAIGEGALVTIDPRRARITLLPIGAR